MKQEEGNMVEDWLNQNHNPEIEIKVLNEALDIALESRYEFAIEFAEWLVIQYNQDTIYSEYTTKELLEIYKKEKTL